MSEDAQVARIAGSWNEEPRMGPIPALGAHTDAILAEIGLSDEAIRAMRDAQAV